jgi:PPOX class probable F420-dependent enzyme
MFVAISGRARDLIEASNVCYLGTIRRDGRPHVHPIWIGIDGDTLLVNTEEGRQWPANVRRDPRVTLTVTDGQNPYEYVEITGRVVEETASGAETNINALAHKYMGCDYPLRADERRLLFKVRADQVVHRVMS